MREGIVQEREALPESKVTVRPNVAQVIRVVEPQMQDFAHAPTNAAFLHTARLAFPDQAIQFSAMPSHLAVIREILSNNAPEIVGEIDWKPLPEPPQGGQSSWWRWNWRVLNDALKAGDPVFFPSLSRMQLVQVKWLMRRVRNARACVILHGDLEELLYPREERFPLSLLSLPKVVQTSTPTGFRYLLLSRSILDNVPVRFSQLVEHAGVAEHPYHFPPASPRAVSEIVFGIFGNTGEGRELETVVKAVKALRPHVRFRLVGFLQDDAAVDRLSPFVEGARSNPVPRKEFMENAQAVTHTLWLARPGTFRLRASATFFDALAFAAPIVFTQNAFIDPYHAEEPGMGWSCRDLDEVVRTVVAIVDGFDPADYTARQEAMVRFRGHFSPAAQAPLFRAATRWESG